MQMQGPGYAAAVRRVSVGPMVLVAFLAAAILAVLAMGGTRGVARGSAPELRPAGPAAAVSLAAPSVQAAGEGVKVTTVRFEAVAAAAAPAPAAATDGAPALRRVAVYLEVRNVGEKVATFTPLDVSLRDSEGEAYAVFDREWNRSPGLPGAALRPGEQIEGWRVFEVPAGADGFVLLYRSDTMDSALEAGLPRLRGAVDDPALEPLSQRP